MGGRAGGMVGMGGRMGGRAGGMVWAAGWGCGGGVGLQAAGLQLGSACIRCLRLAEAQAGPRPASPATPHHSQRSGVAGKRVRVGCRAVERQRRCVGSASGGARKPAGGRGTSTVGDRQGESE